MRDGHPTFNIDTGELAVSPFRPGREHDTLPTVASERDNVDPPRHNVEMLRASLRIADHLTR